MTDEIYPIAAGSPQTALSAAYTFGNSSFAVDDHTKLLDAPNITTIVAPTGEFITVGYTDITGSVVSGITLKDGYSSFIFPIGSVVYRSWSKYDHDAFSDHISDLEDDKVDKAFGVADSVIITDGSGVISSDVIKTAFNSDIATEVPLMDGVADVGDSLKLAKEDHVHPTDTTRAPLDVATTSANGLMSSSDKAKLDGVAAGSQVNVLEGIQIDGVDVAIASKKSNIPLATSLLDGAMSSEDKVSLDAHLVDTTNPHEVTKAQVGLSAVDNTSDADKPVSTAQAAAIGLKVDTAQGIGGANKIVVTDASGDITTLAKKTAFNSDIATATPLVAGTAAVGTSVKLAKEDHVHPLQTTITGNAGTATKLATARTIDGLSFDGSASISRYGVCSTARAVASKVVSITGYALVSGAIAVVKFSNGNVAENPTLNITATGAKPITYKGVAVSPEQIEVGGTYTFVYDGTNYEIIGNLFDDTSNIEVHGFIVDESNSDPQSCITYIGDSIGMGLEARKAKFESKVPHAVVKGAVRQYYVDETDWSLKSDGETSSGVADGLSLDGNFMSEFPTFWFRITPLGTDIHMVEFTWDVPPSGNGWVCCHWYNGTIRLYVWVGTFEGIVDGGKLRSVYSDTLTPTTSMTNEAFRSAAQATGAAEGLTGDDNTYTISQGLVYIMRQILMYWTYGTLNLQTNVTRGIVDDSGSIVGARPVGYEMSLTGGYTQGTPSSVQDYIDNKSAVVNGIVNPYGNVWEFMIDFAYRFGEIAFATDGADHFDITTLTIENWDASIPDTWAKVSGVGTSGGYIRKMLWNAQFPFVSVSTSGSSALTYWSDSTYRSTDDTADNKVPHCCISGGAWAEGSPAGPTSLNLVSVVGRSTGGIGSRLQIFSKE